VVAGHLIGRQVVVVVDDRLRLGELVEELNGSLGLEKEIVVEEVLHGRIDDI
jgi:hypothetical protein